MFDMQIICYLVVYTQHMLDFFYLFTSLFTYLFNYHVILLVDTTCTNGKHCSKKEVFH